VQSHLLTVSELEGRKDRREKGHPPPTAHQPREGPVQTHFTQLPHSSPQPNLKKDNHQSFASHLFLPITIQYNHSVRDNTILKHCSIQSSESPRTVAAVCPPVAALQIASSGHGPVALRGSSYKTLRHGLPRDPRNPPRVTCGYNIGLISNPPRHGPTSTSTTPTTLRSLLYKTRLEDEKQLS
jgi:hypothetical protein